MANGNIQEALMPYQETVNAQAERIRLLNSQVADLKDQLAAVEDALCEAGVWGVVDCDATTYPEAIEILAAGWFHDDDKEEMAEVAYEAYRTSIESGSEQSDQRIPGWSDLGGLGYNEQRKAWEAAAHAVALHVRAESQDNQCPCALCADGPAAEDVGHTQRKQEGPRG